MLRLALLCVLALVGCSLAAEGPYPPPKADDPYPPPRPLDPYPPPRPVDPYPPPRPVDPYPPPAPVNPYPPPKPLDPYPPPKADDPYPPPTPVGPYPPPQGSYPAAADSPQAVQPVVQEEGQVVSPVAVGQQSFFAGAPKGSPALPETLVIPKNTRIKIQDDRLQYTHGFNDDSAGTSVSEQGRLFTTNDGWEYVIIKKGSYSYTSPEGVPVTVNYVADHNGFRVIGELHG